MPVDYAKMAATLQESPYNALGDVDAAAALNALTATRLPYAEFTPSEFVAAFAPILDQISHETDPVKQRKWDFRDTMLAKMQVVSLAAITELGHLTDFVADGYADAALSRLQAAGAAPPGITVAQFVGLLSSRPGTAAEVAGIVEMGGTVDHLDVARARGNG